MIDASTATSFSTDAEGYGCFGLSFGVSAEGCGCFGLSFGVCAEGCGVCGLRNSKLDGGPFVSE